MASAEGQVQNLGYKATFPLLLNIADEPTYFIALKDNAGPVSYTHLYAETFKKYVEENCDSIKVELYPGNALGSQPDTVGAVSAGTVQMTIQNSSLLNNYDPNTMILSLIHI